MVVMDTGRDRLRELLDAVLDEEHGTLDEMAGGAYSSPFHFSRRLTRDAGEPPVAMRRRVMLERAAWQLRRGSTVTDAAFAAGYESVEGFSRAFNRAFGHVPSAVEPAGDHWLPAPNGIHFHPPTSLWVDSQETSVNPLTQQLVGHDLDDTRDLLDHAKALPDDEYRRTRLPGNAVLTFDGDETSLAAVLHRLVATKEIWLASIAGDDMPEQGSDELGELRERHDAVAGRWLSAWRDVDRRGGWDDRLVDALCDPPESFQLASVLAHVLTFSAHRRQLARLMLRTAGHEVDDGDPIMWLRTRRGRSAVTRYRYYTATTLDGFLADENDSLEWLFTQEQDENGSHGSYDEFIKTIGAMVMGATTYEWLGNHMEEKGEEWMYSIPCFVFTHRTFEPLGDGIRFVSGTPSEHRASIEEAAGDRDVWMVGGGALAADFAEAGMLDDALVSIAPVTLGAGRPLFPRRFDLRLTDLGRNGAFVVATYDVVGPRN